MSRPVSFDVLLSSLLIMGAAATVIFFGLTCAKPAPEVAPEVGMIEQPDRWESFGTRPLNVRPSEFLTLFADVMGCLRVNAIPRSPLDAMWLEADSIFTYPGGEKTRALGIWTTAEPERGLPRDVVIVDVSAPVHVLRHEMIHFITQTKHPYVDPLMWACEVPEEAR